MTEQEITDIYGHPNDESPQQVAYQAALAIRDVLALSDELDISVYFRSKLTSAAVICEELSK